MVRDSRAGHRWWYSRRGLRSVYFHHGAALAYRGHYSSVANSKGTGSMTIYYIMGVIALSFIGAVFYRMRGGKPDIPRPIEQMLFCSIFILVGWLTGVEWWFNGLTFAIATAATLTGHGTYFLSRMVKAVEPERMDFLVRPFWGADPRTIEKYKSLRGDNWYMADQRARDEVEAAMIKYGLEKLYWRNVTGMAVTGGIVSLAPGIGIAFVNPLVGLLVAISGFIAKPIAYMVSYKAGHDTEGGEYGTGALQWLFLAIIAAVMYDQRRNKNGTES